MNISWKLIFAALDLFCGEDFFLTLWLIFTFIRYPDDNPCTDCYSKGMGIHILPQEVINQIAAGEVLERPANLVKELVENSIDAGATEIEIDLDQGGRYLKITDNGFGMSEQDLEIALVRHSTSKIDKFSDIWALSSYGFRGEALASTAAVSKMQITTRQKDSNNAFELTSTFGKQNPIQKVGGTFGTQIKIDELFDNVPARLKFLKSESAETSQIMKVIKAFALTHPALSFKVKNKGILKAFYPRNQSHLERVKSILTVDELFEGSQGSSQIKSHVFFSSPNAVSKTAQNIWIFVQKRWIQDRGLQKAILDSYRNLLMHGEYPSCVVFLECDPQIVDVNIHPAKSQVKFQDSSLAFRTVHNTIRTELEKAPWLKNMFNAPTSPAALMNQTPYPKTIQDGNWGCANGTGAPVTPEIAPVGLGVKNALESFSQDFATEQSEFNPSFQSQANFKQKSNFDSFIESQAYNPYRTVAAAEPQKAFEDVSKDPMWGSLQVLSQLNLTYILAQSRTSLFLVDQHASHERVNFEKLMKGFKDGNFEIQTFLIPLSIDIESSKMDALLGLSSELKKLGVEIEQSGPQTISVVSAPHFVKEKALFEMLHKISNDLDENGGTFAIDKVVGDVFASLACHSSIRAGQSLSHDEMQELLSQMDEFPLSSFCPHGRPVFKQILFKELDRDFGRIV